MRDKLGRFIKGYHSSPKTELKKGQHLSKKTELKKGQHLSKKTEFVKIYTKKDRKIRANQYSKKWREKNREKVKAHYLSRRINIPKYKKCDRCESNLAVVKHHEDYSKPLEVEFVCYSCHNQLVKNRGNFAKRFHKLIKNKGRVINLK